MVPVCRNGFLLVSIAGLLLSLSVAPGCCHRCLGTGEKAAPAETGAETGTVGVTVTKEVPHSKETIPEIEGPGEDGSASTQGGYGDAFP